MKKYIFALIGIVILVLTPTYYHKYKLDHTKYVVPKGKLLKETWVWLYDSACYKEQGIYLRKYRKYNYHYSDSIEELGQDGEYTMTRYFVTYRGDTVYIEYIDTTYYPYRRY